LNKLMLAVELEYTVAAYGDDADNYMNYTASHEVSNTRLMFSVFHFF